MPLGCVYSLYPIESAVIPAVTAMLTHAGIVFAAAVNGIVPITIGAGIS